MFGIVHGFSYCKERKQILQAGKADLGVNGRTAVAGRSRARLGSAPPSEQGGTTRRSGARLGPHFTPRGARRAPPALRCAAHLLRQAAAPRYNAGAPAAGRRDGPGGSVHRKRPRPRAAAALGPPSPGPAPAARVPARRSARPRSAPGVAPEARPHRSPPAAAQSRRRGGSRGARAAAAGARAGRGRRAPPRPGRTRCRCRGDGPPPRPGRMEARPRRTAASAPRRGATPRTPCPAKRRPACCEAPARRPLRALRPRPQKRAAVRRRHPPPRQSDGDSGTVDEPRAAPVQRERGRGDALRRFTTAPSTAGRALYGGLSVPPRAQSGPPRAAATCSRAAWRSSPQNGSCAT